MIDLLHFSNTGFNRNHLPSNDLSEEQRDFFKKEATQPKPFVLILGNDRDTRFLFKTVFEIWNYDVAEADEIDQVLLLSEFKTPNLILVDGEIDLRESLRTISALKDYSSFDKCGFVLISGHAQDKVRQKALSGGANYFLVKPVDFELLKQFVYNYFKEKSLAAAC